MDFQKNIREEQLKDKINILKSITTFSEKERKNLAEKGEAMPDGSFPIKNKQDVKDAARQWGRAKDPEAAKSHIIKRAKDLGCENCLPETWGKIKKSDEDGGDIIDKSLNFIGDLLGEEVLNDIEKSINHKYFKREGAPGNYKYYYTEEEYNKKGKSGEEVLRSKIANHYNVSSAKLSTLKLDGTDSDIDLSRALNLPIDDTNFSGVKETIKKLSENKKGNGVESEGDKKN